MAWTLPGLERYIIKAKVGEGGFGQVYYAWDQQLNREAAIKVLANDQLSIAEAQLLAGFDHPHIVKVYDVVTYGSSLYLVMEFVPGPALLNQQLTLDQIIDIGIQCCSALEQIHRAGLVHLDIKPQNLLYNSNNNVCKLTDFGAAARRQLRDDQIVGTPKYIAPEQRLGQPVNDRADIYALAKVLTELIAVNQIKNVPAGLQRLLAKAGSEQAAERCSALEFQSALIQLQSGLENQETAATHTFEGKAAYYQVRDLIFKHYPLISAGIQGLLAGAVFLTLKEQPLIRELGFYSSLFTSYFGPGLAVFVGFFSPALACLLISFVILLPLYAAWPTFALICSLILIFTAGKIKRYPVLTQVIVLMAIWAPQLLWVLPVLIGYYRGAKLAAGSCFALGFAGHLLANLEQTQAYQRLRFTPVNFNVSLVTAVLQQFSVEEVLEIITTAAAWINSPAFGFTLQGVLLGLGARWVARRGTLGMILYLISTAAAVLAVESSLIWYWAAAMLILLAGIGINNLFVGGAAPTRLLTYPETEIATNNL